MIFKNNQISMDTDAEHLARAQMMAVGVATYGVELDFTPAQILEYDTYATDIYAALDSQHEESADVDEAYVAVKEKHEATVAKYRACQSVVQGEMVFAETGTIAWLEEAFDTVDEMPARRGDFVKVAGFALERYNNIALEHPDVALDATLFGDLQTLIDALIIKEKSIPLERGQWREAVAEKNAVRATGEKVPFAGIWH